MDTTKTLAIIGKSGHGKVIADIAYLNGYQHILWIDDDGSKNLPNIEDFLQNYAHLPAVIAIGNNTIRKTIYTKLKAHNITLPTLIHPSAVISPSALIQEACVVMPLVVVNADAKVSEGVILNSASVIEHDNIIEAFTHISPNVALAGNVHIKTLTHIGIGCNVIQGISIGTQCIIAAGSSVITNIPDSVMAAGTPAKIKKELK